MIRCIGETSSGVAKETVEWFMRLEESGGFSINTHEHGANSEVFVV